MALAWTLYTLVMHGVMGMAGSGDTATTKTATAG